MKRSFAVFVLIFAGLIGSAAASGRNDQISIAYLTNHPDAMGSVVEVSAKVIAIGADSKSMKLFDSESRTMIQVNLAQLRKSERSALMRSDVRRVMVSGRARMVDGQLVIDAQKVAALPVKVEGTQTAEAGIDEPR